MVQKHNLIDSKEVNNDTIHDTSISNGVNSSVDNIEEIHNSLRRIFKSSDGKRVLNYWQSSIIERPQASDISVNNIYYLAGERNFILKLKRIINNDK